MGLAEFKLDILASVLGAVGLTSVGLHAGQRCLDAYLIILDGSRIIMRPLRGPGAVR